MIRVYDETGNVIETREHKGDFKEVVSFEQIASSVARLGLRTLRQTDLMTLMLYFIARFPLF